MKVDKRNHFCANTVLLLTFFVHFFPLQPVPQVYLSSFTSATSRLRAINTVAAAKMDKMIGLPAEGWGN